MKLMRWASVCAGALLGVTAVSGQVLVEAEAFQFTGEWSVQGRPGASGGKALATVASTSDALTLIGIKQAGRYVLWTRSLDFANDRPASRRYRLYVDDVPAEQESGRHGREGWYWERVGEAELSTGDHVLALRDTAKLYGRCDAILLTTDAQLDPNVLTPEQLARHRVAPKTLDVNARRVGSPYPRPAAIQQGEQPLLAEIQNEHVRIAFRSARDATGAARIVRQTELRVAGAWQPLPFDGSREMLVLLSSANSGISTASYLPTWPQAKEYMEFELAGKTYRTGTGGRNPFLAGEPKVLEPLRCRVIDAATLEVDYGSGETQAVMAKGRWQLLPDRRDAKFTVSFTAPSAGDYSVGFCAFGPWESGQEQFHLLPPLYQFQRLPSTPAMITSSCTPHPLVLTQGKCAGIDTPVTLAVAADPEALPFVWPTADNARYGFVVQNPEYEVQPASFSPVLGLEGSRLEAGQTKSVSWHVLAMPGDWKQTLEYTSEALFRVSDYRKQERTSLTHAALNMIDLIKDDQAGGWDPQLKGFYNIEGQGVVTHASPLTLLSAALLTNDETFYVQRALPTIEYTLSRPGAHFAAAANTNQHNYVTDESLKLSVPTKFYGTAYWQGVHRLLGQANPWIAELAMDKGEPRYAKSYSAMPLWSELLAAYRLKPEAKLLERIESECQAFLKKDVYGKKTGDLGLPPFYNISFYPYWWDLMDLYELTRNPAYLSAAEEGAFHTMTGQWVAPQAPEGEIGIHPGGKFGGVGRIWWKGQEQYRLGWPRKDGDVQERQVEAWQVSQVGLGFEQPSTYYHPNGGMFNIMMSAWAPNLLRVYGETGREIYQTFARNSIIERFGNYPGYYVVGQTDQMHDPQFPYSGPDLTSIYYHHIPPHLAFTLDFVVTEASVRSKGAISFPWVRQQGYVWFTNRIYGFDQGRIFSDQSVRLTLDRKLADVRSEKVNHLVGVGQDNLWIVLLNEAEDEQTVPVLVGENARLDLNRPYELFDASGTVVSRGTSSSRISVTVPAKGLLALSVPAQISTRPVPKPLADGHVTQEIGEEWGQMHAFRIRSPFGKDSVYVVFTGHPAESSQASLTLEGQEAPMAMNRFPYECSLYGWPMDRDMKLNLTLTSADGVKKDLAPVVLPGTR